MTIAPLLGDLLFRFAAAEFFYYDEGLIVEFMLSCTHARVDKKGRGDEFYRRAASLKDSEVAIRAIANKFYSGSCSLNLAYELHTWAGSSGIPGWLDSMIPLAKAALARLWHALDPQKESLPLTYERLSEVAQFARLIFEYIMFLMISAKSKATISQATKDELTIYIIKEDLFGLLARVLVFPLSCNHSSLSQPHQQSLDSIYNNVFRTLKETGDGLAKICPTSIKELLNSHIDWLKAAQYFEEHCHLYGKGQFVNTYVPKCHVTWKRLGSSLLGKQLKDLSVPCSYPRCPYPAPLEGVPFICGGCQTATYCSHRCRHSHWRYNLPGGSHASTCSRSILALVKG
ncbi:hypothetical protein FRC12_004018 [Ceratobasidium sp. 428]|nr:hypothetical protein FRC12_004018 [Ceratobasidium sp. 428]